MRSVLTALLAATLVAMQPADVPPPPPAPPALDPRAAAFAGWLAAFAPRARAAGVGEATIARELAGLTFNARVVALDRAQPDGASARARFADYRDARVPGRVERGAALVAELAPELAAIEARHGVPGRVLVSIWGLETSFGGNAGDFDLVRSLASLAFDGRRSALFEGELIAALKLIDSGRVARARLVGSWAGATGQPQFLPTSYLAHGTDGDGDGRADIWGSRADTLASIAVYLKAKGWRAGAPWAIGVYVPPGVERWRLRETTAAPACARPLALHSRWLTIAEWRALGLATPARWPADDVLATLIEPDGEGRGGHLAFGNYRAILAYNCSNFYALTVGLLADQI